MPWSGRARQVRAGGPAAGARPSRRAARRPAAAARRLDVGAAADGDGAGGRAVEAEDQPHRGRLARAVRAEEAGHRPGLDARTSGRRPRSGRRTAWSGRVLRSRERRYGARRPAHRPAGPPRWYPGTAVRPGRGRARGSPRAPGPAARASQDPADVGLHRRLGQEQLGRDLRVVAAAPDRDEHLAFAVGQRRSARARWSGRGAAPPVRSSSCRVTRGDRSASPAATVRTAWTSSAGRASLSRKPLAPARSAREGVLVEVEGGEDEHPRPGAEATIAGSPRGRPSRACGRPSGPRPGECGGAATASRPFAASPTTLMSSVAPRIIADPHPDEVLVVDEQDPGHASPSARRTTRTRQPWGATGPASTSPS